MKIDESEIIKVTNNRYRLNYHLMPTSGWMNDPNGFVYFKGYYHIFYQYYPYDSQWGPMHWGHARSKNLIDWERLPAALVPGDKEDEDGCFSGSAIVKDDKLYLIYTGHHYYVKNDPDNFWQNQNLAFSEDGINFTKYENNPIIANPPKDNTIHFRDPKVWEHNGKYYVVIGSQNQEEVGRILMYESEDLLDWVFKGVIAESKSSKIEGFMWECPDLFRLNGKDILLLSPQGIESENKKYLNLFQTGYFVGQLDYDQVSYERDKFTELDHGHDFYATQTMLAQDGRRIVLGWMDMWEAKMPEQVDGWAGALTLPRELTLVDDHLYMNPVEEVKELRTDKCVDGSIKNTKYLLAKLGKKEIELNIDSQLEDWEGNIFTFSMIQKGETKLSLTFNKDNQELILYRHGEDPNRYANLEKCMRLKLQIFIDRSSIELFINDGEVVFSERIYLIDNYDISLESDSPIDMGIQGYFLKGCE